MAQREAELAQKIEELDAEKEALSEQRQKVIRLKFELRFHYDDAKKNHNNFEMEKEDFFNYNDLVHREWCLGDLATPLSDEEKLAKFDSIVAENAVLRSANLQ